MKKLVELARVDGLTRLPDRCAWDEELLKALHRARRTSQPCAVALLDLDHFKRYNDTQGHQAGDALLRETALLLHGRDGANAVKFFERLHGATLDGDRNRTVLAEHARVTA